MKLDDWKDKQRELMEETDKQTEAEAWVEGVNAWFKEKEVDFLIGPAHFNTWGHLKPEVAGFEIFRDEFVIENTVN